MHRYHITIACFVKLELVPLCEMLVALALWFARSFITCAGRLGGISATIAAAETLTLRGYDLAALVVPDAAASSGAGEQGSGSCLGSGSRQGAEASAGFGNAAALAAHFRGRVPVLAVPPCAPPAAGGAPGGSAGGPDAELAAWLQLTGPFFDGLLARLSAWHQARVARLRELGPAAASAIW